MERPGSQDVLLFQPSSARLPNSKSNVCQIEHAVGIGVEAHHDSLLFCHLAVHIRQVKTDRLRIHFEKATPRTRMTDDTRHIYIVGHPFIDEPTARMGQDRKIRAVHSAKDPLGLLLPRELKVAWL